MKISRSTLIIPFLLLVVATTYLPVLDCGFVWDDQFTIIDNDKIKDFSRIGQVLLTHDTAPYFMTGYYRPVTALSFMADYMLWGLQPKGFHLTSLVLHLIATGLLYYLALEILKDQWAAAFAAALFALHPTRVEAVVFISTRNVLLCAVFMLGAMLAHLRGWRVTSFVLYALALFSKEFAVLLPVLLFLYAMLVDRKTAKDSALGIWPFATLVVFYLIARRLAIQYGGELLQEGLLTWLLLLPKVLTTYLRISLAPYPLGWIYRFEAAVDMWFIACIIFLALVAALAYALRRHKLFLWCVAWFFLSLIPVSGLFAIGSSHASERHLYIPAIGFSLAASKYLSTFRYRNHLAFVLLATLAIMTTLRVPIAKDNESLFSYMIKTTPQANTGYINLGAVRLQQGKLDEAETLYAMALERKPLARASVIATTTLLMGRGEFAAAAQVAKRGADALYSDQRIQVIQLLAYRAAALNSNDNSYDKQAREIDAMLRTKLLQPNLKRVKSFALTECIRILENAPERAAALLYAAGSDADFADGLLDGGVLWTQHNRYDLASLWFQRVVELAPKRLDARYNLALSYHLSGDADATKREIQKYLSMGGMPNEATKEMLEQ